MDEGGAHHRQRRDLRRLSEPGADKLTEALFDLLAWIERLPLVAALKLSFWVYPLVNALHVLAIGATVTCVLVMDLRILGRAGFVERGPLLRLMREGVAIAFPVAALTGLALFSIRAQEYATNPAFLAKMALLALAGLNLLAFRLAVRTPGDGEDHPLAARALAVISIALWVAILVAGRMIGFI